MSKHTDELHDEFHGERYLRHYELLSEQARHRLLNTRFIVAGAGGLGCNLLALLVRIAPVQLEIWDPAVLDAPDLNRQVLYTPYDLGRPKAELAVERLAAINPGIRAVGHVQSLNAHTYNELHQAASPPTKPPQGQPQTPTQPTQPTQQPYSAVLDCLDSFPARAGIEPLARELGAPIFHGGVELWFGQTTTLLPEFGYADAFGPDFSAKPPAAKPIMPHIPAVIASLQVAEILSWCENPDSTPLSGVLCLYDGRQHRLEHLRWR
ncbi:MAG: ThiF family adenylyltransferase [Spirochaeta sp.]|nr:ThiF family adenylyltransferase [Spirochaeta sp.]